MRSGGLGSINKNELKEGIGKLIELAEWEETFPPASEMDDQVIE
jgi:hypothetical protein